MVTLGKLYKTYVVDCAGQCGSVRTLDPIKVAGRYRSYKGTMELFLETQGWAKVSGLWYCPNCLRRMENRET